MFGTKFVGLDVYSAVVLPLSNGIKPNQHVRKIQMFMVVEALRYTELVHRLVT